LIKEYILFIDFVCLFVEHMLLKITTDVFGFILYVEAVYGAYHNTALVSLVKEATGFVALENCVTISYLCILKEG
jgi:hypothetical protein